MSFTSDSLVLHSENGWSTAETMEDYLNWLSEKAEHRKCALILDQYLSHTDQSVSIFAKSLGIELIFLPVGTTGLLQPLDRNDYGVLKNQNKRDQIEEQVPVDGKRFSFIHEQTSKNFKNISDKCIESAWKIPYLSCYLP